MLPMISTLKSIGPYLEREITSLLVYAWQKVRPDVVELISNPAGTVSRLGDTLVWTGEGAQRVIGGLETLADSQARINVAVNGIETTQLAMQGTLGFVQTMSVATFGMTTLTGACMWWRLQSLDKRLTSLNAAIKGVAGNIAAMNKGTLKNATQNLRDYEQQKPDEKQDLLLQKSRDDAQSATNVFAEDVLDEAMEAHPRLNVLNYRGRLYTVSFLTELRCLMLQDQPAQAIRRIEDERPNFRKLLEVTFAQTIKSDPERYFSPAFGKQPVSLGVLANIFQKARQLGIIDKPCIDSANCMFDEIRTKLAQGHDWIKMQLLRRRVEEELKNLRYLLACLEDVSKVEGLSLMIDDLHKRNVSIMALTEQLEGQSSNQQMTASVPAPRLGDSLPVFAYAL